MSITRVSSRAVFLCYIMGTCSTDTFAGGCWHVSISSSIAKATVVLLLLLFITNPCSSSTCSLLHYLAKKKGCLCRGLNKARCNAFGRASYGRCVRLYLFLPTLGASYYQRLSCLPLGGAPIKPEFGPSLLLGCRSLCNRS